MTRVFCTSTRTPTDGSTRDSSSTASTAWKKRGAGAAVRLGDLDAHDAEIEQLVDERCGILACSSISRTSGRISRVGELAHAVPEKAFVLGQNTVSGGVSRASRARRTSDWAK